jgi:hypothetical protein
MPQKKGNALCSHPAFYPAAPQCFTEIEQILHNHILSKIIRIYISIINKKISKFAEIITNSKWAVMAER